MSCLFYQLRSRIFGVSVLYYGRMEWLMSATAERFAEGKEKLTRSMSELEMTATAALEVAGQAPPAVLAKKLKGWKKWKRQLSLVLLSSTPMDGRASSMKYLTPSCEDDTSAPAVPPTTSLSASTTSESTATATISTAREVNRQKVVPLNAAGKHVRGREERFRSAKFLATGTDDPSCCNAEGGDKDQESRSARTRAIPANSNDVTHDRGHSTAMESLREVHSASDGSTNFDDDGMLTLIASVPADQPLIRYVAEWYRDELMRWISCVARMELPIEWQLFFTCIEQRRWKLAHALAERLQRKLIFDAKASIPLSARQSVIVGESKGASRSERVDYKPESIDEVRGPRDVVLAFLNECAS